MRKDAISKTEYQRIHWWLRKRYGKPTKCESKTCTGVGKRIEWALKRNRTYSCDRKDYIRLCKSCHAKYDFTEETRRKLSLNHVAIRKERKCKKCSVPILAVYNQKWCEGCRPAMSYRTKRRCDLRRKEEMKIYKQKYFLEHRDHLLALMRKYNAIYKYRRVYK